MLRIVEIIPDNMPDWARVDMAEGQLLNRVFSKITALEARLKRLGSKESMTLQIIVGNVEPKFDYKAEYFTRIDYANEAIK